MAKTWIDFVRPLLASGHTLDEASILFVEKYYPKTLAAAKHIADEAILAAKSIPLPPESAGLPDDVSVGLQLVRDLINRELVA